MKIKHKTIATDLNTQLLSLTHLSEKEHDWKIKTNIFAEQKIKPVVRQMEKEARISPALMKDLFAEGFMSIEIPKIYGGLSGNFFQVIIAVEEVARIDPSVAVYIDVQNILMTRAILGWGSGDQKRQYLPRLARTTVGAFALSEKEAGSDAFALSTIAVPDGNDFILNGSKYWTSGAREAEVFLVFARIEREERNQITAFIVERSTPGLKVAESIDKLGIRANSTCELTLNNVRIRRENILGRIGEGEQIAIDLLTIGRVGIAAQMIGLAQGAFEIAISYAQERKQFGKQIASFQGIQFSLAKMATEIEAARLLVYNSARLVVTETSPLLRFRTGAMSKYFSSEVAERVASQAVDILGGSGFSKNYLAEKFYRDAKIGKIYEGTTNMQLRTIASTLLHSRCDNL